MRCWIRDTTADDVPAIFALRHDPRVLAEQYRPGLFDTPKMFARNLAAGPNWQGFEFKCTSILIDEQLVGHVIQHHFRRSTGGECVCGWNLEPSHWGQGIMPAALTMLFDKLFQEDRLDSVVACCFTTNTRCQRVVAKLGFEPEQPGLFERISHYISARGIREILKYRLTAEQWSRRAAKHDAKGDDLSIPPAGTMMGDSPIRRSTP